MGYRTLAATGRILGVSAQRVLEFIEHGPLIGRTMPEGLMVHEDDLRAFRRPLFSVGPVSDNRRVANHAAEDSSTNQPVVESLQLATSIPRAVAESPFQSRRGTMGSKAYRALSDVAEVRRQGERFILNTVPDGECLRWTGYADKKTGYGYFRTYPEPTTVAAHRFAWVLTNGVVIPEKHDVDHLCPHRWCVGGLHLEAVTHAENIRRRDRRRTGSLPPDWREAAIARATARHLRLVTP